MARVSKEQKERSRAISNANLRPISLTERSPEEARAIRSEGGKASQKVLERRRNIKEIMSDLLALDCPEGAANLGELTQAATEAAKDMGRPLTLYEAGTLAQVAQMMQGNTRAAEFVRDSAGDKPGDALQVEGGLSTGDAALLNKLAQLQGLKADEKSE